MFVPVLRIPGMSLMPADPAAWTLLLHGETQLTEAAVALELFLQNPKGKQTKEQWRARVENSRQVREAAAHIAGLPDDRWALRRSDADIPIAAWEAAWASAAPPMGTERRPAFIFARSFVFAIDGIARVLMQLENRPGVAQTLADFRAALPHLKGVRDSAHHDDQRIQGLDRKGNAITPGGLHGVVQPGVAVIMSGLVNDALTYTTEDGTQGQVRVCVDTLKVAQAAMQRALDAFTWHGPARISPS